MHFSRAIATAICEIKYFQVEFISFKAFLYIAVRTYMYTFHLSLYNAWHSCRQNWRLFCRLFGKTSDTFGGQLLPLVNPFARFGNYNLC